MSVQEDYLRGIANAIREKDGTSDPIKATDFASRIRAIVGNSDSFTATAGTYQQQRLAEIAEAIRAAEGSSGKIPAGTFAERIKAIQPPGKDWVTERVEEAMAKLAELEETVPTDTVEGQRQYIKLIFAPWIFLTSYDVTQTGGNPDNFGAIYAEALDSVQGILDEAGIYIYIEDFKVNPTIRNIDVTMSVNGETIEWETPYNSASKSRFIEIIIETTGGLTEDVIYILMANAQELFEAGYQMMDDVYGYSEQ